MSLAELETGSIRKFRRRKGDFAPWDSLEPADKDRYLLGLGIAGSSKAEGLIHPTKAGLLMFGRLEAIRRVWPCYEVKYKRYRGIGTVEVLEEEFGECNLFEFWCGVAYKLTLDLKVPFGLSEQFGLSGIGLSGIGPSGIEPSGIGLSGMQRLGVTPAHYAIWEAFERCGLKIKMPKFEESREQDKLTVTIWM